MDTATARQLAQYRAWADARTYRTIAALPAGEATKERGTLFKSIVGTLNHNYLIDLVWQAHLEGRDHGFDRRSLTLHADLADLWHAQRSMNQWWVDWSEAQTDLTLVETVHFRFIGGDASTMTHGAILMHVVNHATYHRGWIDQVTFEIPAESPATDLPVFLHERSRRVPTESR